MAEKASKDLARGQERAFMQGVEWAFEYIKRVEKQKQTASELKQIQATNEAMELVNKLYRKIEMDKERCKECSHYILQVDYETRRTYPACDIIKNEYGDCEFIKNIERCPRRKR